LSTFGYISSLNDFTAEGYSHRTSTAPGTT
jgi:hypothetical protein